MTRAYPAGEVLPDIQQRRLNLVFQACTETSDTEGDNQGPEWGHLAIQHQNACLHSTSHGRDIAE